MYLQYVSPISGKVETEEIYAGFMSATEKEYYVLSKSDSSHDPGVPSNRMYLLRDGLIPTSGVFPKLGVERLFAVKPGDTFKYPTKKYIRLDDTEIKKLLTKVYKPQMY